MNSHRSHFLLLPFLAAGLYAQIVPVTHTFNDPQTFPVGLWEGGGGWSTTQTGDTRFTVTDGGVDGTNYVAYFFSGGGFGATASRPMTAPSINEQFTVSFNYATSNMWGTQVGLGPTARSGLTLTGDLNGGPFARLTLGDTNVSYLGGLLLSDPWHSLQMEVDLGANGGSGSVSVFARPASSGTWTAISGMTNLNLGLDPTRTAGDASNPLNWDTLWFHHEGATSGIDNIALSSMSAVPEPSTYAAIAGAAMLGLAVWRRRHKPSA